MYFIEIQYKIYNALLLLKKNHFFLPLSLMLQNAVELLDSPRRRLQHSHDVLYSPRQLLQPSHDVLYIGNFNTLMMYCTRPN